MPNSIKVECDQCGYIWLDARRVILTLGPGGSSYRFECVCGALGVRHCSKKIAGLLADFVKIECVQPEPHSGPPITALEVMDAILALGEEGWESELA